MRYRISSPVCTCAIDHEKHRVMENHNTSNFIFIPPPKTLHTKLSKGQSERGFTGFTIILQMKIKYFYCPNICQFPAWHCLQAMLYQGFYWHVKRIKNDCSFNQLAYANKISLWCRLIIHEEESAARVLVLKTADKVSSPPTRVGGRKKLDRIRTPVQYCRSLCFSQIYQPFLLWILVFSLPVIHCTSSPNPPLVQRQVFINCIACVTAVLRSAVSSFQMQQLVENLKP